MATLYRTNGEVEEYPAPTNGSDYSLTELRSVTDGGYIEICYLNDGSLMIIDEEGKLKGLDYNANATEVYQNLKLVGMMVSTDTICGDALVCDYDQVK